MNYMKFDVRAIYEAEILFRDSFTKRQDTSFGILYYNPLNPLSHDSNHAHIMNGLDNPEQTLRYIKDFYRELDVPPRIFHSFIQNELEILTPFMESEGFSVSDWEAVTFLYPYDNHPIPDKSVPVRRVTTVTDDIIDLIHTEDYDDWTINVLKTHLNDQRFHLLGWYEDDKAVALASVKTFNGISRVDDVMTHTGYRGKHIGTRLMEYLVAYHKSVSDNYLYLWATNPVAIRMYRNVGFEEIPFDMPYWSAVAEL